MSAVNGGLRLSNSAWTQTIDKSETKSARRTMPLTAWGGAGRTCASDTPHGAQEQNCRFVRGCGHTSARNSHSGRPPRPSILDVPSCTDSDARTVVNPRRTKGDAHVVRSKGQHPSAARYKRGSHPPHQAFSIFAYVCWLSINTTRPLGRYRIGWCPPQPVFSSLARLADGTNANAVHVAAHRG